MSGAELLAGAAIGLSIDLAKHGVNLLRENGSAARLAKKTIDDVGGPLRKKRLTKWLNSQTAWQLLAPLDVLGRQVGDSRLMGV